MLIWTFGEPLGVLWGLLGRPFGLLGASWGALGASRSLLGIRGAEFKVVAFC